MPDTINFEKPVGSVVDPEHLNGNNVFVTKDDLIVTARLHRYVGTNDATYDYVGDEIAAHTVTLSGSTWSADWDHLPAAFVDAEGNLVPYVYAVEETSVTVPTEIMADASGNAIDIKDVFKATSTKSADGKTITMQNTLASDDDYYLTVTKKWLDGNNNVVTDEDPVEFKLLRDTSETTVGGSSSGSPVTIYVTNDSNAGATNIGISKTAYPGDTVRFRTDTLSFRFDQWNVYTFNVEVYYWDTVSNPNYPHWEKDNAYESSTSMSVTVTDRNMCFLIHGNKAPDSELENANISLTVIPATSTTTTTGEVMMPDPDHAGKYIVDSTGNHTFSLNPSQTINFTNLPYLVEEGNVTTTYKYTVVETTTGAFSTTVTYADGKAYYDPTPSEGDKGVDGSVTITNKKSTVNEYGDAMLRLKKVKKGTTDPIENVLFTLTNGQTTVASGQTNANGELSLTIPGSALGKHSGSGDTSTTRTFTLTETVPAGYDEPAENPWTVTVTANGATSTVSGEVTTIHYNWQVTGVGSLSGNEGVYTIENEPTTGSLKLKKQVSVNGTPVNNNSTLADGTYTFMIYKKTGETTYTTTATRTVTITITNGAMASVTGATMVNGYAVVSDLEEGDYKIVEDEPANGVSLFAVTSGKGTDYANVSGRYAIVHVTGGDTEAAQDDAQATFTNNINTTSLNVSKTVVSPVPADSNKQFTFTVTVTKADGGNLTGTFGIYTFDANGQTTVTTTGTQTVTISGLPQGATYTVTEAEDVDFTNTSKTDDTGTLESTASIAAFTNTRNTGSMTVTKALRGKDTDAAPTGTYTFPIRVTTSVGGTTYYVAYNNTTSKYELTTTQTELTVTNGTSLTISGLPTTQSGAVLVYKVEEVNPGAVAVTGYSNVTVNGTTVESVDNISVTETTVDTANLVNVYERDRGSLNIQKTVQLNGQNTTDAKLNGTYRFTIVSAQDVTPATSKVVEMTFNGGTVTATIKDSEAAGVGEELTVTSGTVRIDNLPTGSYTVAEDTSTLTNGISLVGNNEQTIVVAKDQTSDIPTAAFINNMPYITATPKATKVFTDLGKTGQDTSAASTLWPDGGFTFTLSGPYGDDYTTSHTDAAQVNMTTRTVTPTCENQTQTFSAITFKKAGLYYFTVTETVPATQIPGVVYDTTPHHVLVTVTDTNGVLSAAVSYPDGGDETNGIVITNKYDEVTAHPEVRKELTGRDWKQGDTFTFTMVAKRDDHTDGANGTSTFAAVTAGKVVMPGIATAEIAAESDDNGGYTAGGSATFNDITFKEPGTYTFEITEVEPQGTENHVKDGITYSQKRALTQFVVSRDSSTGVLSVTGPTYTMAVKDAGGDDAGLQTFTNTYSATGAVDFTAQKTFKNGSLAAGQFSFKLTQVTSEEDTTPVTSPLANGIQTKTNTATSGTTDTISFDRINFAEGPGNDVNQTGTYWFLLEEVVPQGADSGHVKDNIRYDTTKTLIRVIVADNKDGSLSVTKAKKVGEIWINVTDSTNPDASFTNEQLTFINGKKVWKNESGDQYRPANVTVTLQLQQYQRDINSQGVWSATSETHTVTITINENGTQYTKTVDNDASTTEAFTNIVSTEAYNTEYDAVMRYTWDKLPKTSNDGTYEYSYMVTETACSSGYHRENGENSEYLTVETDSNEQVITNVKFSTVSLPATGGPGTTLYYVAGASLLLLAIGFLLRRKRNYD